MTLREILLVMLSGGVALGPVIYGAVEYAGWPESIQPKYRRPLVAFAAAVLSLGAWALAFWLGYVPTPVDKQAWAEGIWSYGIVAGLSAFGGATVLHGFTKLKG